MELCRCGHMAKEHIQGLCVYHGCSCPGYVCCSPWVGLPVIPKDSPDPDMELLAECLHEMWGNWRKHILSKGHQQVSVNMRTQESKTLGVLLDQELLDLWETSSSVPYAQLEVDAKFAPQLQARMILATLRAKKKAP